MKAIRINGFEIDYNLVQYPNRYSGYFVKESFALIMYETNYTKLVNFKEANKLLSAYINSSAIDDYKIKIEEPPLFISSIGKSLIDDFNYNYLHF